MEDKRKVILGFEEPSEMEGDEIYMTFSYGGTVYGNSCSNCMVDVKIVSADEFLCRTEGKLYLRKEMELSRIDYGIDDVIDSIVANNDAQVDNLKLFEQAEDVRSKIAKAMASLGVPEQDLEDRVQEVKTRGYPELISEGCMDYQRIGNAKELLKAKGVVYFRLIE